MKKVLFTAITVFGFIFSNAQEATVKAGVHVGLPMGDIKDYSTVNVGADFTFLWGVTDNFKAGFGTGITAYLTKKQETQTIFSTARANEDASIFLPITGSAEYSFSKNIFAGADLGYAIGIAPDEAEGGLLYQPKVGYQAEKFDIVLGYKVITKDGGTFSSVNLGFAYKF